MGVQFSSLKLCVWSSLTMPELWGCTLLTSASPMDDRETALSGLACFLLFWPPLTEVFPGFYCFPVSSIHSTSHTGTSPLSSASDDSQTYVSSQIFPEVWIQIPRGSGFVQLNIPQALQTQHLQPSPPTQTWPFPTPNLSLRSVDWNPCLQGPFVLPVSTALHSGLQNEFMQMITSTVS